MKKAIPFITPIAFGVLGGLTVESLMCFLSIVMSPFASAAVAPFYYFCIVVMILAGAAAMVMIVVDAIYLINLDNARRAKLILAAQAVAGLALMFVSWSLWSPLFNWIFFAV
jgi:hypothetical protein